MTRPLQLPLFAAQPQTPDDIHPATPLQATFDLFAQQLAKDGKSEHTVTAFTSDLYLVAEFLGGETPIRALDTHDLNRFLDWLENGRDVPCSRKSYARRVTTLKVYFKWLKTIGALDYDPAQTVLQRSGPAPLSDVLTAAQIAACVQAARAMKTRKGEPDTRPELLFRLLVDTGIKKNETMSLAPSSIDQTDPRHPVLHVRFKARSVFKERNIALRRDWPPLLGLYLAQYTPKKHLFECTARNLEYVLTDVGKLADMPFRLSFEVLRWTCALRDYLDGMAEDAIREKLGLSEISWHETGAKIRRMAEAQTENT